MQRHTILPRHGWQDTVTEQGLVYHTASDGKPYWNKSAYYEFAADEIDTIEAATQELHERCIDAARHVIENDLLGRIGIPEAAHRAIRWSWAHQEPSLYGRFDLGYDGSGQPKMLEYNADTPTSILEAAVIQWYWLQDRFPDADQFNSLWEGMVETWRDLRTHAALPGSRLYFTSGKNNEDWMTISLLRDTAAEAGIATEEIFVKDIGWHTSRRVFVDLENRAIESIFKLYPWEWILKDEFGRQVLETYGRMLWIEPIWKLVLSCKGILPVLWKLFPDHPNLLACYADSPQGLTEYAAKPIISREGANIQLHTKHDDVATTGRYAEYSCVYQQLYPLPVLDGNFAVVGSWIVGGKARGMGIRESDGPITDNLARFVPHLFKS